MTTDDQLTRLRKAKADLEAAALWLDWAEVQGTHFEAKLAKREEAEAQSALLVIELEIINSKE